MPVRAGEHSGWPWGGVTVISGPWDPGGDGSHQDIFFFDWIVPEEGVSRVVGELNWAARGRTSQLLCSSWDLCVRGQKPSSIATVL